MREIEIDFTGINTKEALHLLIRDNLDLPDYYGNNLDALYDCLTDINEPMKIVFKGSRNCRESSHEMEEYFPRLCNVFEDACKESENLNFALIDEDKEGVGIQGADSVDDLRIRRNEEMDGLKFRDLNRQYEILKEDIDNAIAGVLKNGNFIGGSEVDELEKELAGYVGAKHCITCGNGTDALIAALMCWDIGPGDAVFVPDFTFFASGEAVSVCGATPVFVDVSSDTFNMEPRLLEKSIQKIKSEGKLKPRAVIAVDLFGLPASMDIIREICDENELFLLEDGAQGFGGSLNDKMACSFGDISITSFFPAKPLGCYGDGGAIFTDSDEWAEALRSICVHGKGGDKYDNIRIGMNSRLDTIQAAILRVKLRAFAEDELDKVNRVADAYRMAFRLRFGDGSTRLWLHKIPDGYKSSYAQFTIRFADEETRDGVKNYLKENGIPTMVYYPKPLHMQKAFGVSDDYGMDVAVTTKLCKTVLSLPMHPYLNAKDIAEIVDAIWEYFGKPEPEADMNPFSHISDQNSEYGTR